MSLRVNIERSRPVRSLGRRAHEDGRERSQTTLPAGFCSWLRGNESAVGEGHAEDGLAPHKNRAEFRGEPGSSPTSDPTAIRVNNRF